MTCDRVGSVIHQVRKGMTRQNIAKSFQGFAEDRRKAM